MVIYLFLIISLRKFWWSLLQGWIGDWNEKIKDLIKLWGLGWDLKGSRMVEAGVLWRRLAVKESLTKEFDINWRCWWRWCWWWWGWGGQQFVQMFPLWLFSTWSVAGRWQLPPVHQADSWANTCQLLCHQEGAILSLYQSSSNSLLSTLYLAG